MTTESFEFSSKNEIDLFNVTVGNGPQFLTEYVINSRFEYSLANVGSSALSAIFPISNGCSLGKNTRCSVIYFVKKILIISNSAEFLNRLHWVCCQMF